MTRRIHHNQVLQFPHQTMSQRITGALLGVPPWAHLLISAAAALWAGYQLVFRGSGEGYFWFIIAVIFAGTTAVTMAVLQWAQFTVNSTNPADFAAMSELRFLRFAKALLRLEGFRVASSTLIPPEGKYLIARKGKTRLLVLCLNFPQVTYGSGPPQAMLADMGLLDLNNCRIMTTGKFAPPGQEWGKAHGIPIFEFGENNG